MVKLCKLVLLSKNKGRGLQLRQRGVPVGPYTAPLLLFMQSHVAALTFPRVEDTD